MKPTIYLLLIVTSIAFVLRFWTLNIYNTKYRANTASYYAFCAVYFAITAIGTLIVLGWDGINKVTFILSLFYGTLYIFNLFFYMKAVLVGPIGYSALITSLSLIIPIVYAAIVYKDTFKVTQLIGLGLLMVSFYFGSVASKTGESKPMNLKWAIYILSAFFIGGALGTLFKEQQVRYPGQYIGGFLTVAFTLATVLSLVLAWVFTKTERSSVQGFANKRVWLVALGVGVTTLAGNILNLSLSSKVPSIILFPIVNGGNVALTTVLSYTYFKERVTVKGIVGLVIGVVAMCLIGI